MTPAKIYSFSIPAGGSFPLLVIGDYAKILTSSGALTLQGDTFGSIGPILAGQGVADSQFNRLVLVDQSGATNNGTILIADNVFIDDRITGEVSIIDGAKFRSLANIGFSITNGTTSDATTPPAICIANPVGSGKNIIIEDIGISFSTTSDCAVSWHSGTTGVDVSASAVVSKSLSGTFVTKVYQHTTGAFAAQIKNPISTVFAAANNFYLFNYKEPIVIRPGNQIYVRGQGIVSNVIKPVVQGYEEVIL